MRINAVVSSARFRKKVPARKLLEGALKWSSCPNLRLLMVQELAQRFGSARPRLQQLAKQIGMPAPTLQTYLEGRRRPKPENINRLASFFYPESEVDRKAFQRRLTKAL